MTTKKSKKKEQTKALKIVRTQPFKKTNPIIKMLELRDEKNILIATINGTGNQDKTAILFSSASLMLEALKEEREARSGDLKHLKEALTFLEKNDTQEVKTMLQDQIRFLENKKLTKAAIKSATRKTIK